MWRKGIGGDEEEEGCYVRVEWERKEIEYTCDEPWRTRVQLKAPPIRPRTPFTPSRGSSVWTHLQPCPRRRRRRQWRTRR